MVIAQIFPVTASAEGRGHVHLRHKKIYHTMPPLKQPYAGLTVDSYVINTGVPQADPGYGIASNTFAQALSVTIGTSHLPPSSINTGSTARFLPQAAYMDGTYWWPVGGSSGSYPRMLHPVAGDPVLDVNYSYRLGSTRKYNPGYTFNGKGYTHFQTSATPNPDASVTQIWVIVPHYGQAGYWSLFDNETFNSNRLILRYAKGFLQLYFGTGHVCSVNSGARAGEPLVVALSMDTVSNRGSLLTTDRKRASKQFKIPATAKHNGCGYMGVGLSATAVIDARRYGDFELLEYNYYNSALSIHRMEQIISLLAPAYGVMR